MITYTDFRSGMTFQTVRDVLSHEQPVAKQAGLYMFVSRGTVLGRMREYKLGAYAHYKMDQSCCGAFDSETCRSCPL